MCGSLSLEGRSRAAKLEAIVDRERRCSTCRQVVSIADGRVRLEWTLDNVALLVVGDTHRVKLLVGADEVKSFRLEAYIVWRIVSVVLLTQLQHVFGLFIENLSIELLVSEEVTELQFESGFIIEGRSSLGALQVEPEDRVQNAFVVLYTIL